MHMHPLSSVQDRKCVQGISVMIAASQRIQIKRLRIKNKTELFCGQERGWLEALPPDAL